MKKKMTAVSILSAMLMSHAAQSSTFYTLTLLSIKTGWNAGRTYTLERTKITDNRVTDDMTIAEAYQAMGLYGMSSQKSAIFRIIHRDWRPGQIQYQTMTAYIIDSLPTGKGSDNFVEFMSQLPPAVSFRTPYWGMADGITACASLGPGTYEGTVNWTNAEYWHGLGVASRECDYRIPAENEWCAASTPSITFDYGTRTVADALGTTLATEVKVECTTATKYSLRLKGLPSDLPLNNGMTATLTTDGQPAGSTLSGVKGVNTVRLESTLSGTPDKAGPFNGEGVLFIQLH